MWSRIWSRKRALAYSPCEKAQYNIEDLLSRSKEWDPPSGVYGEALMLRTCQSKEMQDLAIAYQSAYDKAIAAIDANPQLDKEISENVPCFQRNDFAVSETPRLSGQGSVSKKPLQAISDWDNIQIQKKIVGQLRKETLKAIYKEHPTWRLNNFLENAHTFIIVGAKEICDCSLGLLWGLKCLITGDIPSLDSGTRKRR